MGIHRVNRQCVRQRERQGERDRERDDTEGDEKRNGGEETTGEKKK
jgi:hypothetical protein